MTNRNNVKHKTKNKKNQTFLSYSCDIKRHYEPLGVFFLKREGQGVRAPPSRVAGTAASLTDVLCWFQRAASEFRSSAARKARKAVCPVSQACFEDQSWMKQRQRSCSCSQMDVWATKAKHKHLPAAQRNANNQYHKDQHLLPSVLLRG